MTRIILLAALLCSQFFSKAQISAVTNSGDEVILYNNGTWKYVNKVDSPAKEIPTNNSNFQKPSGSTFKVNSTTVTNASVYLNPKKWEFKKAESGASEYKFELKAKDAYGMLITERIQIPLLTLKEAALMNAKNASPDINLVKEEYRTVNEIKLIYLQMEGSIQGIDFTYCGYYYSSEQGTVQLVTCTSKQLLKEYRSEMEDLLNGLIISKSTDTK